MSKNLKYGSKSGRYLGKSISPRGNNKCKGPEVGVYPVYSLNSKEAHVAKVGQRGRVRGDEKWGQVRSSAFTLRWRALVTFEQRTDKSSLTSLVAV